MKKLNQACVRRKKHRSHTERYREDDEYRAEMVQKGVPEWLVFHSTGHTFRLDVEAGDQWPA